MRTARRFELRIQSANHAPPVLVISRLVCHTSRADRSLTERRRPVGPSPTSGVDHHDIERGSVLVDGHESLTPLLANCDLEPCDSAQGALLEVGKDPLHEWMPGGEKVEGLFLQCLFAVERADVARPAGNAG